MTICDKFNREVWFSKHGFDVAKVFADKTVAALKEKGITTFGAVGFCYGGAHSLYS